MASVILYCRNKDCGHGYASLGELPVRCPACGEITKWNTSPPVSADRVVLKLTADDRLFLRKGKISAE